MRWHSRQPAGFRIAAECFELERCHSSTQSRNLDERRIMKTTLVFATALLMVTARDANAQWEVGPILSGETRAEPSARAGATIRFNWTVQGPIDYVPMPHAAGPAGASATANAAAQGWAGRREAIVASPPASTASVVPGAHRVMSRTSLIVS